MQTTSRRVAALALAAAFGCANDGDGTSAAWMPDDSSGGAITTGATTSATAAGGSSDGGGVGETRGGGESSSAGDDGPDASSSGDGGVCLMPTDPCSADAECCDGRCGSTSLGTVCCGDIDAPCTTANGEDCCDDLLCVAGSCVDPATVVCEPACTQAPALVLEKNRLAAIGGSVLGICGDANHTYGYHVPAANLPASDYSLEGAANVPVCEWHAAAIDIGMDWPASREWLAWLIEGIRTDQLVGIAEVIGSYDGVDVRYWSDDSGWSQEGVPYTGSGHDTWTHVSIYRSTALQDHGILSGWNADGMP